MQNQQDKQSLRSSDLKTKQGRLGSLRQFKNLTLPFVPDFKEERTQKFTTIVLTVITLSFFGIFAINPTISTILRLQRELEDDKLVDAKLAEKIQNISTLQKKYASLQADLPIILSAIPQNAEVPLFAAQTQGVAKNSNVAIENFQTFEVETGKSATRKYASFSFALSVSGSYNDLYKFLTTLANMQRVVAIDLLSLTKKTGNSQLELAIKGKAFFSQ